MLSVAAAVSCSNLDALGALVCSVAPAATSWGIEIDPDQLQALPAFGCAIPTAVRAWPEPFASAPAVVLLRALLRSEQVDGHWFLEMDACSSRQGMPYAEPPHCFARLSFAVRNPAATSALLLEAASRLGLAPRSAAALAERVTAIGCMTDLGVIERAKGPQARAGVALAAEGGAFSGQLARLHRESGFGLAVAGLIVSFPVALRCTAQLSLRSAEPQLQLIGLELSTSADDWPALLQHLHVQGVLDAAAASSARAWPGQMVLPRVGTAWPSTFVRAISHVKLVPRAGKLATKIYLSAAERFSLFA